MYLKKVTSGEIGAFANYQDGWLPANSEDAPVPQEEIDIWLMGIAKKQKVSILKTALKLFQIAGFVYLTHTFSLFPDNVNNIKTVQDLSASNPDRYKFCDITHALRDFVDEAGYIVFKDAILDEYDRIMKKYNAYRVQIDACLTIEEVDAITVDFSS